MQSRGRFVWVLWGVAAVASPLACSLGPVIDVPIRGSDSGPSESSDGPGGGLMDDGGLGAGDDLSSGDGPVLGQPGAAAGGGSEATGGGAAAGGDAAMTGGSGSGSGGSLGGAAGAVQTP